MKRKHIGVLVLSASICLGGLTMVSCSSENNGPTETEKLEFEKTLYEVSSGDAVTVKGNLSDVTYSFQGGAPEGVTLDSKTGVITFDESLDTLPEKKYIAIKGDEQAITTVRFKTVEAKPVVTFTNVSDYVLNGDSISAKAVTDSGREYSVSYSLKESVDGITIDAASGVVRFGANVADGTKFTVVATSNGVSEEHEFVAMTEHIIYSETESQIVEALSGQDATFVLNFNGNTEGDTATTSENLEIAVNGTVLTDRSGFTYDVATKTITLKSALLSTLGTGEIDVKALTQRNAVTLNLTIADKFIYSANDFHTIFAPDYSGEAPTFKEGSLAGYYVLANDIDLTSYLSEGGLGYNDGKGWLPIGAYSDAVYDIPFTGTFDGNGHTISGFYINNNQLFVGGFFGRNSGTIKNMKLVGTIDAIGSWSAALVGNNSDMGVIENVIVDVNMPNEGQSATGTIASTNWGKISNAFSINEKVTGFNETAQAWAKAGIAVGLNETTGVLENIYAVSTDFDEETGAYKYGLFGHSNNAEVTQESAGKLFKSQEEMKAFDFSSVISDPIFNFVEGELPALNVPFTPSTAGYIAFENLPSYLFVGDTYEASVSIYPEIYQEELKDDVEYTISGVDGATVTGNAIDLTNAVVEDTATLTINASLTVGSKILTATGTIPVYKEVTSVEITNQETAIDEGGSLVLTTTLTPNIEDAEVTYEVSASTAWMTAPYITVTGNVVTLDENIPAGLESITVTAEAYGVRSGSVTFGVRHLGTIAENNVVHYGEDASTYDYTLPEAEREIRSVKVDGVALEASEYIFEDHVIKINGSAINGAKDTMRKILIETSYGIFNAYASSLTREEYDEEWIKANETEVIEIASVEDFKKYFPTDGKMTEEFKANMAKTYMLTADIDFAGEAIIPVGTVLDENGNLTESADNTNFTGKIYGLGHTISNYECNGNAFGGLFRQVEGGIFDLTIDGANIHNNNSLFAGTLAGILGGGATIENVNVVNSSVTNTSEAIPGNTSGTNIGGLAGKSWIDAKYSTYNGFNVDLYVK